MFPSVPWQGSLVDRKKFFWSVKKSSHLSSKVFFWNKSRKKTDRTPANTHFTLKWCCVCVCLLNELIHYRQLSSKSYKSSAVAEMGDHLATIDMGEKCRGLLCPFQWGGELGPHLSQYGLGRGLPPYQVASWTIQPFGHNTPTLQTGQTD